MGEEPQLVQNYQGTSANPQHDSHSARPLPCLPSPALPTEGAPYHVGNEFGVETVPREHTLVALDEADVLGRRVQDARALLEAHAAATRHATLDLGQLGLVDEGAAVAVAAVGLGGLFGGHGEAGMRGFLGAVVYLVGEDGGSERGNGGAGWEFREWLRGLQILSWTLNPIKRIRQLEPCFWLSWASAMLPWRAAFKGSKVTCCARMLC